ncbi:hypothetical protein FYJ24_05840 [Actinomycetaceae bacterium WB03_NA08]|uniref:Lipoprotein n=1 Tax=Scrofimicrobium canadense TaxID=2652290 RepID=A0A6N7VRB7_9ACTO|nr:hypothetical protein [Scrofimicrobium canadense]MSS84294.1 hypothetical protein [Scrofimicrobium canadense]
MKLRHHRQVTHIITACLLGILLASCGATGSGVETVQSRGSGKGDTTMVAPGERITWNEMIAAYGLGRYPNKGELPEIVEDWRSHIPATNRDAPAYYPFVQYQHLTFKELGTALEEPLMEALSEIEETLGVGPWEDHQGSGGRCGPADPNSEYHFGIGRYVLLSKVTSVDPTDEQYAQMIEILNKYYPGINKRENQYRSSDEEGKRNYMMAADTDDMISIWMEQGSGGARVTLDSGCYIATGH